MHPFRLFPQRDGIHHIFFCSVTLGSGDRPREEGCHNGGVYSFSLLMGFGEMWGGNPRRRSNHDCLVILFNEEKLLAG